MSTLTGQYISASYGGVIHLSTNQSISAGTFTALEDGLGNNLGILVNGQGSISSSNYIGTASYATNANLLDGLDSTAFVSTGSFGAQTASFNAFSASILSYTSSQNNRNGTYTTTASFNAFSASILSYTASQDNRNGTFTTTASFNAFSSSILSYTSSNNAAIADILLETASINLFSASLLSFTASQKNSNGTFATTGSNTFIGNEIIRGNATITGSLLLSGSAVISGSAFGAVRALTITSQTASIDFSAGNYFTLALPTGSNVFLNPINIQIGQTAILEITQPLSGSVSTVTYPLSITFPQNFAYTASAALTAPDTINFISFNGSTLRAIAANQYQ
jgi:hypothetical protein